VEVLLEVRVIALDRGHTRCLCNAQAGIVGSEGSVDVYDVERLARLAARVLGVSDGHEPVFGIEYQIARRNAYHSPVVIPCARILRRNERRAAAEGLEVATEGRIDVETPLTRGKYTSEIISTCTAFPDRSPLVRSCRCDDPQFSLPYSALYSRKPVAGRSFSSTNVRKINPQRRRLPP